MLRLKIGKDLWQVRGCQGSNQNVFCAVTPDIHDLWCALCRLVWLVTFWWEEVVSFGIHAYKCGFREGFAFVSSFVRIS